MTPREFERAASVLARAELPPDRPSLAALMQIYPDMNGGSADHG